ncbi:MFS transporter [Amorphoplanes digitatis]|uniref:MFS family permease n=1 Tax=Actinoplanes digitatis TaxID=1868 RepID=A0A7W7MNM7_9ACTN|nr:MFS transporter [Actinoplanes digitatis]MBB4760504.1 MFS family permease [Actinoplanes digitatis]BFE68667.1 MFS transporter [Actinoplanes digitatis]GID98174.1 MFS transporter [Actinoplanes digitatis]
MTDDRRRLEAAKVAVGITFAINGLGFAGWFARVPAVREDLGLSSAGLGLLLLCLSGAAIAAIPLAGPLVQRLGPARSVLIGSMAVVLGLLGLACGTMFGSVPLAGVGLMLLGVGNSTWDVAMNVEGADVERRLGRTLMPRFHAGFSLGTVAGAGVSAAAAAIGVALSTQLFLMAALAAIVMTLTVRRFLPHAPATAEQRTAGRVRDAWREPRTLLIGVIMLGFGFTEGAANDWLAIGLVDGYHATETVGAIGFGFFVVAMTLGRLFGGSAIERWGRVTVLRATAVSALLGLLLAVSGIGVPVVLVGALLWGAGASLGFPIGMSAAADDPLRAAIRVSVAGSIGYAAFLAGPPLIGVLAEHFGVLRALLVVLVAIGLGLAASAAARPLPIGRAARDEPVATP